MWQNVVEGRVVPWSLLVHDMPKEKHHDLNFILSQLDWEGNVDPQFHEHHYLEPIAVSQTAKDGYLDRWIVYGRIDGEQLFTAKELMLQPGAKATLRDNGANGLVCVQGQGKMNALRLAAPTMIRFGELSEDEVFCTESAARAGITFENTSDLEPLVTLRFFGPEMNPDAPDVGDYRR